MTKRLEHLESSVAGTCTHIPQVAAVLSALGLSSVPSVFWKADFCEPFWWVQPTRGCGRRPAREERSKHFGPPAPLCGATVLAAATF